MKTLKKFGVKYVIFVKFVMVKITKIAPKSTKVSFFKPQGTKVKYDQITSTKL